MVKLRPVPPMFMDMKLDLGDRFNDMVQCPYDKTHVIKDLKFLRHILRCRKQHPELAKSIDICPYNFTHHVPKADMKTHLIECKYRQVYIHNWASGDRFDPVEMDKIMFYGVNSTDESPLAIQLRGNDEKTEDKVIELDFDELAAEWI